MGKYDFEATVTNQVRLYVYLSFFHVLSRSSARTKSFFEFHVRILKKISIKIETKFESILSIFET